MLMVDMVLRVDEQSVETEFEIKGDNIFVQDGTFTESGLIENAAQTCSAVVARDFFAEINSQDKTEPEIVGFISSIKSLKIHGLPRVGDHISTKAVLVSKFVTDDYSLCTMNCQTFSNEELLLEGDINLFIQDIIKMSPLNNS